MNYDDFQSNIRSAGLTNCEFAKLFKMNKISLSNYARKGSVPSHLAALSILLKVMAENAIDFREPIMQIEISAKKPRGMGKNVSFRSRGER